MHDTGAVPAQPLPLAGHPLALLPVIVQEAAKVPQLLVIFLQLLVDVLQAADLAEVELEAAVHLADEVAVVQHSAHLLGLGAAEAADQLLLAPLEQLLVRHLGQILGRRCPATFRRHFGHGGGPAARGTRGASPRSRGRPTAAAGGKGEPGARGVPLAPALGRG